MYICEFCGAIPQPGTACHKVVTAWRLKQYPFRPGAKVEKRWVKDKKGRLSKKKVLVDDKGGVGREIVRECLACPTCAGVQEPKI